jgi:hypothetical protein
VILYPSVFDFALSLLKLVILNAAKDPCDVIAQAPPKSSIKKNGFIPTEVEAVKTQLAIDVVLGRVIFILLGFLIRFL